MATEEERSSSVRRNRSPSRHHHRLPKLTCFCPVASHSPSSSRDGGHRLDRRDVAGGGGASTGATPAHLVVMVNGIIGSAGDWRFAAKELVKRFPEDVIVQRSRCNYHTLTLHGVDVMGNRLADEVLSVAKLLPGLKRISFIGHSLGGLIARFAIAKLYSEATSEAVDFMERESRGTIAGLEPINFITFATPHLGSRWHKQVPFLCGSRTLEKVAVWTSWVLGRSGRHLFLSDNDAPIPLLLQMSTDTNDLKFMLCFPCNGPSNLAQYVQIVMVMSFLYRSALRSFHRRVAYSNACSDNIVGWQTSSIRHKIECPKREQFIKDSKYPHVVHVEAPQDQSTQQQEIVDNQVVNVVDVEEAMILGLNKVGWERVDVSFRKSIQRILAHSTIQVQTHFLHSDGVDIINHMVDNFVL